MAFSTSPDGAWTEPLGSSTNIALIYPLVPAGSGQPPCLPVT